MTICKTLPGKRYYHRVHRSVKGRKKRKPREAKTPIYFVRKKKEDEIILSEKIQKIIDDPLAGLTDLEQVIPAPKKECYPFLICEVCGHFNQLHFSALKEPGLLEGVVCEQCHHFAYYSHYWKNYDLLDHFMTYSFLRDFIKQGKMNLC